MLPHEEMFPSGDGVASPECSLRRSTLSVYSLVEGARRSEAVGDPRGVFLNGADSRRSLAHINSLIWVQKPGSPAPVG